MTEQHDAAPFGVGPIGDPPPPCGRSAVALELVPQRIVAEAANRPRAVAVVAGRKVIDYATLADHATALARRLVVAGAGFDRVIGLATPRSIEGFVGLLGILLSGSAYLYVDPTLPARRVAHMLGECAVSIVVATGDTTLPAGTRHIDIATDLSAVGTSGRAPRAAAVDVPPSRTPAAPGRRRPRAAGVRPHQSAAAGPGDLAYVVYTSGSTGMPRGVAVEHRSLAHIMQELASMLRVGPGTRMAQLASWSWDAAVCEILVPLTVGGTVVLAPPKVRGGGEPLTKFLASARIQVATITPSVLAATPAAELPDLHTLVAVGEPCPAQLIARWTTPGRRFLNGYGPTEATVAVSIGECRPGGRVHIGAPIPGVRVRVVDPLGQPVTEGGRGELLVSGVGLARGYIVAAPTSGQRHVDVKADPEATPPTVATVDDGRFFRDTDAVRWFRTGDRVRQRADATLVHLGRLDDQVQVHGQRVELGEVEATLRQIPGVAACVVTVHGGRLVAHVVPTGVPADPEAATDQIVRGARDWLPEHMVPQVRLVTRLPITVGGKADRSALTAPPPANRTATRDGRGQRRRTATPADALVDAVLGDVLAVVRQVLHEPRLQAGDDLFVEGGHSLLAAQLAVAMSARFGVDLPALSVVDHPTAAGLADVIRAASPAAAARPAQNRSAHRRV